MVSSAALILGVCLLSVTAAQGAERCAELTLREREGEVRSPNFPQQYYPNTCTIWTVEKPEGAVVTISFKYLDLPQDPDVGNCYSNYLEIGSPGHMKAVCGQHTQPYTSSLSDLHFTIKFISGLNPLGHGFQMSYIVGPLYLLRCNFGQYHCKTGKCIPGSWKCNGQKECEDGSDEFDCHDIQRPATLQPILQRPTTPLPFHQQHPSTRGCSHVLHNRTGRFELLVSQENNVYEACSWLIDVPGNVDKIVLHFLQNNIYSDACVWVYKGRKADISNYLGMFNGKSDVQTVTSYSSAMFVEFSFAFHSPTSVFRDLIFSAEYSAYGNSVSSYTSPPTSSLAPRACYHHLYQRVGNFTMPPRPFHHKDIHSCIWHIDKPYAGSYIHLIFTTLHLQDGESVKVYDGRSNHAVSLAVITSSSQLPTPVSVRSSGSHMLVQFTTPHRNRTRDHWMVFEAKYHFEDSCDLAGELRCGEEDNKCYRPSQSCDGIWDCPLSGADEEACYLCPTHSYSCGDFGHKRTAKCYFKRDRCNGASVCPNGADEKNCNDQLCLESKGLFLCANKYCIPDGLICDGTNDCGDNSDEEGCSLGNSRKVIVAAVVGSLLCSLLLVLSLGCACKFYNLRHNQHPQHHQHRASRYDTPLSRLQAEMFRRRAPPPPYHEAMLTSRPYDEAVREYLTQTQQAQERESTEQESQGAEQVDSGNVGADNGDQSVQNLINLMDFSEQDEEQHQNFAERSGRLEIRISSDTSSDSDSEAEDDNHHSISLAEDASGQIEMTENLGRGSLGSHQSADDEGLREDISEDSASASLSADGTEMVPVGEEGGRDRGKPEQECSSLQEPAEESDKESNSDADSVCILCLDEDPAAPDDGSDTQCLLQDV